MNLEFCFLKDKTSDRYKAVVAIYLDLFPVNERQPLAVFEERITSGKTELLIAVNESRVLGFAVLWNFEQSDFALLDYLAVDKNWQGRRVGYGLMQEIVRKAASWGKDLVIEIERPGEGKNQRERENRLQFYLRNDARILNKVSYLLPAFDGSNPVPMVLMVVQQKGKAHYSGKEIKALIQHIYSLVYQKTENDAALLSCILTVPETVELTNVLM
jgi:GNAT superfamily N-acetyltransferase